jgi:hypothetical protein
MKRYLVIANQTLADPQLCEAIAASVASGSCHFHIVVPATPMPGLTWTDGAALAVAHRRMEEAIALVRVHGASVEGEVGDASPVVAAGDAVRREPPYDGIIVSTFPPGISRWLKMDLPRWLERLFGVPVHHVVAARADSPPRRAT